MIKYAWTSVKNNKSSSALFIIAMIAILTVSTISLHSIKDIQAQVDDDIKHFARGSYDILVRAKDSQTPVEKTLGVVEENYLGAGNGGITIEMWKKIQSMKEIEIAAPVASLGYFTGFSRTVDFPFPESSSLLSASFIISDGIHEYQWGDKKETFYLKQDGYFDGFDSLKDFKRRTETSVSGEKPRFMIPQSFHLVMGIDFEQEGKLTGIPFNELIRELTPEEQMFMSFAEKAAIIKVLYLKDPKISVKININIQNIPWETKDTLALKEKLGISTSHDGMLEFVDDEARKSIIEYLSNLEPISNTSYTFDLSNQVTPFYFEPFSVDYNGNISPSENYATSISESSQFYSTSPVEYQIKKDYLAVKQVGEQDHVPTYREIKKHGQPGYYNTTAVPFLFVPINAFSAKEYEKSLAASPLGIYHQAPTTTKDGTVVHETAVPGSFISSPAHGLIDINDTVHIKGEKPIDAIRIKVAGIHQYDEEAEKKILHVVEQLHKLGDFHIDIVAGASPKTMQLDVEGIGMVTQQWTSLGSAAKITDGWNLSNMLISGLFILVGFIYILNRIFFWKNTRKNETKILTDIGWSDRHINTFHFLELGILGVIATFISFIIMCSFIYFQLLDGSSLLLLSGICFLFGFIIFIICLKPSNYQLTIKQGAPGKSIFVRNLYYYRKFIVLTFIQLMIITILLYFVIGSISTTSSLTSDTNLGSYIYNAISFSLLLIMVVSVILAVITVAESNTSFLTLRQTEMLTLRDIGWKRKTIQRLYLKETATWTACSIFLGTILGICLFVITFEFTLFMTLIALLISVVLYGIVLITSYFVISKQIHSSRIFL